MLQQQQFIFLEEAIQQAEVLQRSLTTNSPGGGVILPSATAPPAAVPPSKVVHIHPTVEMDDDEQLGNLGESLEQKSQDSHFTEEQCAEFLSLYKEVRKCQFPHDLRRLKDHLEAGESIKLELGLYRLQRDLYFLGTDSKDQLAGVRQDLESTRLQVSAS